MDGFAQTCREDRDTSMRKHFKCLRGGWDGRNESGRETYLNIRTLHMVSSGIDVATKS